MYKKYAAHTFLNEIHPLMKDPHLRLMLDGYNNMAHTFRLWDGVGKVFCVRMADIVLGYGLCIRNRKDFLCKFFYTYTLETCLHNV